MAAQMVQLLIEQFAAQGRPLMMRNQRPCSHSHCAKPVFQGDPRRPLENGVNGQPPSVARFSHHAEGEGKGERLQGFPTVPTRVCESGFASHSHVAWCSGLMCV